MRIFVGLCLAFLLGTGCAATEEGTTLGDHLDQADAIGQAAGGICATSWDCGLDLDCVGGVCAAAECQ